MVNSTSLSDLTDDKVMNNDPYFLNKIPNAVTVSTKLNFRTGRSAHVAQTLLHKSDILHAQEQNQMNAEKGKQMKEKLEKAKKLTAMLNFKTFGCKIREYSLKARLEMAEKKHKEEERIIQKKNDQLAKRKTQYIELQQKIINENMLVEKLTLQQLKVHCMYKKEMGIRFSSLSSNIRICLLCGWNGKADRILVSVP